MTEETLHEKIESWMHPDRRPPGQAESESPVVDKLQLIKDAQVPRRNEKVLPVDASSSERAEALAEETAADNEESGAAWKVAAKNNAK